MTDRFFTAPPLPRLTEEMYRALTNDNLWLIDSQLKYITATLDTRSGGIVSFQDRDGRPVEAEHIISCHQKALEQWGEPTR